MTTVRPPKDSAWFANRLSFDFTSFSMNCSMLMISSRRCARDATAPSSYQSQDPKAASEQRLTIAVGQLRYMIVII
jgi:hypothetical protein